MSKFGLLMDHLNEAGIACSGNRFRPGRCRQEWLHAVHSPDYIERFRNNGLTPRELKRVNLPWSEGLVRRTVTSPAGTVLAAQLALHYGVACHQAGGTHHAQYDVAAGFCIINDLAVTSHVLLERNRLERILIFDCDVHQGDGTARLLADEPRAITCSIHCGRNFPFTKALSDVDVALPDGLEDDDYLNEVSNCLHAQLDRWQPDLVLYAAGVDIYAGDPLGRLGVSLEGIRQREALVLDTLKQRQIPVATVIAGGYDDDREALARRHAFVTEEACRLYP
ncbi:histone deacetylase [uncultured Halovibrio sp.]|uniref:histone deacetylase family protein n=1 Tax=uncultured Halovibrio sp. TaxID=985049 RepID=UPI0025E94D9F|nr:histone deacetylase [uncultured Halovibrio sp.]